jgi:hypothetical protein
MLGHGTCEHNLAATGYVGSDMLHKPVCEQFLCLHLLLRRFYRNQDLPEHLLHDNNFRNKVLKHGDGMTGMRLAIVLLLLVFLLGFGCLEQKDFPGTTQEQVTDTQAVDLQGNGVPDYTIYTFAPVTISESGMTLQRTVTVATESSGTYTALASGLTAQDVLDTKTDLDSFSNSSNQAESDCLDALGMGSVVCSDMPTCTRLCSTASSDCRMIASVYGDVLAGSMLSYIQDMTDIQNSLVDAQRMATTLDSSTPQDRNAFLADIESIDGDIAEANANPLYTQSDVSLCTHSDYGISSLLEAARGIGNYQTTPVKYIYTVMLSAKPISVSSKSASIEVSGISITDALPIAAIQEPQGISSIQEITTAENNPDVYISWNSTKASSEGYLFAYQFASALPPPAVLSSLVVPTLTVKSVDLTALMYTEQLFNSLEGIVKNYYLALGMALGFTIAAILLAIDVLLFVFALINEHALSAAFRKAFSKTSVSWKPDAVLAIIALAAGAYVSIVVASQPPTAPTLVESLDYLVQNGTGMVGVAFVLIGVLLAYFAVENFLKIRILEIAYGVMRRRERDALMIQAAKLKAMLGELKASIESARQENIDVDQEYGVFSSITQEKIDALAKSMNVQNKVLVDEYGSRVENAVKSLADKRKLIEDNWPKWSASITKLLEGQEEVNVYYLVDIPVSLRAWAVGRYLREKGNEGIVLDHEVLKRKRMTLDQIVRDMLERKMITGAIVMNDEKVEFAEFTDGSSETVRSVLLLKLRAYMNSLARNTGQRGPVSLLVVGNNIAMVYLREKNADNFLFIGKDKFTQTMEQWKARTKMLG